MQEKAPSFSLYNQHDQIVTLSQFQGQKVLLYFYPKDDTPGCTIEAQQFTAKKNAFAELNTKVLGVSKDSTESHRDFCDKYTLGIDLLSDPDQSVINAYGVWGEKNLYGKISMGIIRSTFLIDEEGNIQKIWRNVKAEGHAESVMKFISAQ